MVRKDETKADNWNRGFTKWWREWKLGWISYYALTALFVSLASLELYFAFTTKWLARTSSWLGLHSMLLHILATFSILGIVSNIVTSILLPRLRSFDPVGWIMIFLSIISMRLPGMLTYAVKLEEPDKSWRIEWWLQAIVLLILNVAVIFFAALFSNNVPKHREMDYWPWDQNTMGQSGTHDA